ncbi:pilus assembly protein TadG-related protein [Shewanella sp. 3B26]|uniref:Pilus assembly protein TadG-related protein n=1 Tax=Shewanella zhuhaiensis TaxID=2919576 RepID=A0AAJ1BE64_9GAMM|nr:pilus assembly protein TadG-related protein [Shewanella zhuhaiensis]MCH4293086.1 pilus assembly protein TadG-related protein [Shewanella zhuhaiensis]
MLKTRQRGQAMILSVILLGFAVMAMLFGFNASQLNHQGTKLQYTADNAAYSLAAIAARDLNFKAYTNRAAVANQVAVAQMVGLSAWFNMTETFTDNACDLLCWVPYLGQAINAVANVTRTVNQGAQPFFEVVIDLENVVLKLISGAQYAVNYAGFVGGIDTARKIVEVNDPDARLDLMQNPLMINDVKSIWMDFQKRFSREDSDDGTQYQDFLAVTGASRDNFSKGSNYKLGFPWSLRLWPIRWATKKAGGSDLISNGSSEAETWTSAHTLGIHLERWSCKRFRCKWRGGEIPVGWGGTRSDERTSLSDVNSNNVWGRSRATNSRATYLAAYNEETRGDYDGIQPFYALDNKGDGKSETDNIAIVISKSQGYVRTSARLSVGHTNTNPALNEKMLGDRMSAMASASVFYSRPNDLSSWLRRDKKTEYGNLYNPFWQPHLTDDSGVDRRWVYFLTNVI